MHPHRLRKRFGQHFLHDQMIIQQIVAVIAPTPAQTLVEIGPGAGALTFPLLKKAGKLTVVEFDRDLIMPLQQAAAGMGELIIHQADALQFDFGALTTAHQQLRVVGNLPYNISTPLIFHLLNYAEKINDMCFMLQKEVVGRLAAAPGTKAYGRLSVMVQYHCAVTALFNVAPEAFTPPPKVDSAIVRLVPWQKLPYPAKDFAHFADIVKSAFSQRRKTLRNCLKGKVDEEMWGKLAIDATRRPEQLSVAEYVAISNQQN